jgi:hypothetical protein
MLMPPAGSTALESPAFQETCRVARSAREQQKTLRRWLREGFDPAIDVAMRLHLKPPLPANAQQRMSPIVRQDDRSISARSDAERVRLPDPFRMHLVRR